MYCATLQSGQIKYLNHVDLDEESRSSLLSDQSVNSTVLCVIFPQPSVTLRIRFRCAHTVMHGCFLTVWQTSQLSIPDSQNHVYGKTALLIRDWSPSAGGQHHVNDPLAGTRLLHGLFRESV